MRLFNCVEIAYKKRASEHGHTQDEPIPHLIH